MEFKKEIALGTVGSLVLSEDAGVASVELLLAESLADGVVKGSMSTKIELDAIQLIDLGFELAKHKFPAIGGLIDGAKTAIDAEFKPAPETATAI